MSQRPPNPLKVLLALVVMVVILSSFSMAVLLLAVFVHPLAAAALVILGLAYTMWVRR